MAYDMLRKTAHLFYQSMVGFLLLNSVCIRQVQLKFSDTYRREHFIILSMGFCFLPLKNSVECYLFLCFRKRTHQMIKCPQFNKETLNVSRHLQSKQHGFSRKEARIAVSKYGLRKTKKPMTNKLPFSLALKHCPFSGCFKTARQMDEHLFQCQEVPNGPENRKLVKQAKPFDLKNGWLRASL